MGFFRRHREAPPRPAPEPPPHRSLLRDERTYRVYPSNLSVSAAFERLFQHFRDDCQYVDRSDQTCVRYRVKVDDARTVTAQDSREFLRILKEVQQAESVSVHSHWHARGDFLFALDVDIRSRDVEIAVLSLDLTLIGGVHDSAQRIFEASNPPAERSPSTERYNLKKSVFLAHRFDEAGFKAATVARRLLVRMGFSVLEGEGYEARPIPDKVADRIKTQDIFLCIVTPGDMTWLASEGGFAKAHGKYLVVMCEEGVAFSPGVIGGDHEYIAFPKDLIEKGFIDLLYALPT